MRDHRPVHVDRALGPAGGAAREVQQAHRLGVGGADAERGRLRRHRVAPGVHACIVGLRVSRGLAHDDHVLEPGQAFTQPLQLALVQLGRGHHHARVAHLAARGNGLGPEGRKQRAHRATRLQRTEHRHVQLGQPPHQHEHPLAGLHAQGHQGIGEAVGLGGQVGVRQLAPLTRLADPADRHLAAAPVLQVPVDRLMGDVQAAGRQPVEQARGIAPAEARPLGRQVGEIGRHGERIGVLDDPGKAVGGGATGRRVHRRSSSGCPTASPARALPMIRLAASP